MSGSESRIARRWAAVDVGAEPQRHGSLETAKHCTIRDGGKCELCRRVLPDSKKRHKVAVKARRTSACTVGGVKNHPKCAGWRFAPGNSSSDVVPREPLRCTCPCHTDGRGRPIPPFEDWLADREMDRARNEAWHAANPRASGNGVAKRQELTEDAPVELTPNRATTEEAT